MCLSRGCTGNRGTGRAAGCRSAWKRRGRKQPRVAAPGRRAAGPQRPGADSAARSERSRRADSFPGAGAKDCSVSLMGRGSASAGCRSRTRTTRAGSPPRTRRMFRWNRSMLSLTGSRCRHGGCPGIPGYPGARMPGRGPDFCAAGTVTSDVAGGRFGPRSPDGSRPGWILRSVSPAARTMGLATVAMRSESWTSGVIEHEPVLCAEVLSIVAPQPGEVV